MTLVNERNEMKTMHWVETEGGGREGRVLGEGKGRGKLEGEGKEGEGLGGQLLDLDRVGLEGEGGGYIGWRRNLGRRKGRIEDKAQNT